MGLIELLLVAAGLSMDAFAVSICAGLSMPRVTVRKALIVGLYFGVFQAAMPLAGYLVGSRFSHLIESVDHWIAFGLLALIGGKMIFESRKCGEEETAGEQSLRPAAMLPLAIATSIDALAVGVTFAFLSVNVVPAASLIGVTTLLLSMAGVKIGGVFGKKFKSHAEFSGGVILVLIGAKILVEHLGVL